MFGFGRTVDLTVVTTYYEDGSSTEVVASDEFDRFLEANLQLHHEPGLNPHNQNEAARAERITVRKIKMPKGKVLVSGPYWWSTPGLQENGDRRGAKIYYDVKPRDYAAIPEVQIWARESVP